MTTPRVTICPNCQTSFRVTQAQLRAASGSVRCGSCMQVFDARTQMGETSQTPEETPSQPASATEPSKPDNAEEILTTDKAQESESGFHDILHTLDKEHLELDETQDKKSGKRLIWALLSLLAIITLGLQVAWFNKDTLSLKPELRSAYEWTCQQLNCQLPAQLDPKAIKSTQMLVRTHPEAEGVLIVDSVIINEAPFPQPWPKLEILFSDINNQPVASRQFKPREYLGGTLAGSREIPSLQPVRLSLEILDPGSNAINYKLRTIPTPH